MRLRPKKPSHYGLPLSFRSGGPGRQRLLQPDKCALKLVIWNDGKGGTFLERTKVTIDGLVHQPDVFAEFLCSLQFLNGVKASAPDFDFLV